MLHAPSDDAAENTPPLGGPWLRALPRAVMALDTEGRVLSSTPSAAERIGLDISELHGQKFSDVALRESARGGFGQVLDLALGGNGWRGELRIRSQTDDQLVRVEVAPVRDDGTVIGVVLTIDPPEREGDRAQYLSERLTRLAKVAAELQSTNDLAGLTNVVVSHMADAAGATTASFSIMVDDENLALIGLRGGPPDAASKWATFPADDGNPAGTAIRIRQPLFLPNREVLMERYPDLDLAAVGQRSMLCLPLVISDRAIGVATMSFPVETEIDDAEMEFFQVMADTCAQALQRIQAQEIVDAQHAKLRFLAEASAELSSSLDYESTLKNVAWLAVPDIADWCSVSLEQDGILRTLAVAHSDPDKIALVEELQEKYPSEPDEDSGNYQVLRTGETLLMPEVPDELLVEAAVDETHLEMIRQLNLRSALTVALQARGRSLGTITWVNGETGRRFGPEDVVFGEDLARRAAVAIDNSLLHSELRDVADRLQDAVLPPALPALEGWELGASYSSAGRVAVGGDFYDAITLQDGRLALIIGDVMGRGVEAAAAMSQIRAALRAFIAVDPEPQVVLNRLDMLYERFPSDQLVTLIYALVDPRRDQIVLCCAGHPPPLVMNEDGSVEFIEAAKGTILGVQRTERRRTVVPFKAGQTLLMFTDGLLERRGEDLEAGKDRLLEACRTLQPTPNKKVLDELTEVMRDPTRDDDVAVIAARRTH